MVEKNNFVADSMKKALEEVTGLKFKDEDGYVNDWEIRKYSDCHPSSAQRVFTKQELRGILSRIVKQPTLHKLYKELDL